MDFTSEGFELAERTIQLEDDGAESKGHKGTLNEHRHELKLGIDEQALKFSVGLQVFVHSSNSRPDS